MKVAIVDKNIQSAQLIKNSLDNIENIRLTEIFQNFNTDFSKTNLIIFDINSQDSAEILDKIKTIKLAHENIKIIATSYEINSQLVSQVLSLGVDDFLLKPLIPSVLEASIKKINFKNKDKKAKTICIFSPKGGVGKTTLATNLGFELSQRTDDKICILDLSFNSEDALNFLNIKQKNDIDFILNNIENSKKEAFLALLPKYEDTNMYVIEAQEEIIPEFKFTPQKITRIINLLKNIFDYIIIDTTSIINEANVSIFCASDLILLLSSTNTTSVKNTLKSYELFDKIGYNNDKIKLIINRFIENQESINIEKEIFHKIPNNYLTLVDAINQGKCVSQANPQSNIAKSYQKLAQDILDIDFEKLNSQTKYNHGIFNLLHRMGEE